MATQMVKLISLIMAGLLAGILLGIVLGYNPAGYSASTYAEQQQGAIRALNTLMPIFGLITNLFTITAAILQRKNKTILFSLLAASVLFIITGLVTRFGNQPINSIVMTWDIAAPPANWTELRDNWWFFHQIRTLTAFLAFCLIAWTGIQKKYVVA